MKRTLKFTTPIKVETAGRAKVIINGEEVKLDEITAVRYEFGNAWITQAPNGEQQFNIALAELVAHNREQFNKSLHIVELNANLGPALGPVIDYIRSYCKVAVFVYADYMGEIDISFTNDIAAIRDSFLQGKVDRVMLREHESAGLDAVGARNVIKYVAGVLEDKKGLNVGLCNSPIGCTLGLSCLSAVKCRELSAVYGDGLDMAIPSQNHEGTFRDSSRACNCLGFVEVFEVKPCPVKETKSKRSGESKAKADKHVKEKKKPLGKKVMLRW